MKIFSFIIGLMIAMKFVPAQATGVYWTSVKACQGGYDVQHMTGYFNRVSTSKYVLTVSRDSLFSLQKQLQEKMQLTDSFIREMGQGEVTTPSWGRFERTLSFGKLVAQEYDNGYKVELSIFDNSSKKIANYYFTRCN